MPTIQRPYPGDVDARVIAGLQAGGTPLAIGLATPAAAAQIALTARTDQDSYRIYVLDELSGSVKSSVLAGTSHDAGTDLLALNAAMRAYRATHPNVLWELILPPHKIQYVRNDWLRGVGGVKLVGAGAGRTGTILECTSSDAWSVNKCHLNVTTMMTGWTIGSLYPTGAAYYTGYKFATVKAGNNLITFLNAGDESNFAIGDPVFLFGFDQQFNGWSPNMRYFEWHEVTAVDTTAHTVTLRQVLKYNYNQSWPDPAINRGLPGGSAYNMGAPRIINLNRSSENEKLLTHFEAHRIRFSSTNYTNAWPNISARVQRYYDCVSEQRFGPYEGEDIRFVRCRSRDLEMDKLTDRVLCEQFYGSGDVASAAGTQLVHFKGPGAVPNNFRPTPNVLIVEDMTINGQWNPAPANVGQEQIVARRNKFITMNFGNSGLNNGLESFVTPRTLVAETAGAGGEIQMTIATAAKQTNVSEIRPGTLLYNVDGSNAGYVLDVVQDGTATYFLVSGTWKNNPGASETYYYYPVQNWVDGGDNRATEEYRGVWGGVVAYPEDQAKHGAVKVWRKSFWELYPTRANSGPVGGWPHIYGHWLEFRCNVSRAYAGSGGAPRLAFRGTSSVGGAAYTLATIDLALTGPRVIRKTSATSQLVGGNDSVTATAADLLKPLMQVQVFTYNSATSTALPEASLSITDANAKLLPELGVELHFIRSRGALA